MSDIQLKPLSHLLSSQFHTPAIARALVMAARKLAEFKGVAGTIPHQDILLSSLVLQEAKDSSAIENIVTTHDEIFRTDLFPESLYPAAKEVVNYRQALMVGYEAIKTNGILTANTIISIQAELEKNSAGFRKLPGTMLKDGAGNTVYTPPQDPRLIVELITDLERFINAGDEVDLDPLVKMAIIHHQFESIHPFYDGNGRTGRIINVLFLIKEGLLDNPLLYMSRYIVNRKADYYRLLQSVREDGNWEEWTIYMLNAVEHSAADAIGMVRSIKSLLSRMKEEIQQEFKFYSQDLISSLFRHPYTKIEYIERDLGVSRLTATKYLDSLSAAGLLLKQKVGRSNYYINLGLMEVLTQEER